jgi:hypothetical protein
VRPRSIVYFEVLQLSALVLGVVQTVLSWPEYVRAGSVEFALLGAAIAFVLVLALTLLVSRRRSRVAMWVSIAFFVVGLPGFLGLLGRGQVPGSEAISILQIAGQATALALLFTPSARAWLNGDQPPV